MREEKESLEWHKKTMFAACILFIKMDAKFLAPQQVIVDAEWKIKGLSPPASPMTYGQLREHVDLLGRLLNLLDKIIRKETITAKEHQQLLERKILANVREIKEYNNVVDENAHPVDGFSYF
jgi:hypothetical protein